jgi:hypothetical protein
LLQAVGEEDAKRGKKEAAKEGEAELALIGVAAAG